MQIDSTRAPDDFNEAAANAFCEEISKGRTITAVCNAPGMPTLSQQARWRRAIPAFKARVIEAKELGAEAMANETVDIADTEKDPQVARNRIDTRKWLAGVIKPKEYGPRVDLNVTQTVDYSQAHTEAKARLRLMRDLPQTLVAQVVDGVEVFAPCATDNESVAPAVSPSIFD